MKITITGSLGNISRPLATTLIKNGHEVSIISSKPTKLSDIEAIGGLAAIGSLDDAGFLEKTFSGADAAYLMIPPNFSETNLRGYYQRIGRNYVRAIQKSGLKQVVFLSSLGAEQAQGTGVILGTHDVEGLLNGIENIGITHIRPGYFYYNLSGFIPMIKSQGNISTNYGNETSILMADAKDIAAAAAEELQNIITGVQVRYIISDERQANEIARVIGTQISKPELQWIMTTNEQMQSGLEHSGMSAPVAAMIVEMGAAIRDGLLRLDFDHHKPAKKGKVKLEDFAREFAEAYRRTDHLV